MGVYKRVSTNGSWYFEDLQQATKPLKNGLSIRWSAKRHGIPKSTLQRESQKNDVSLSHFGRKKCLSPEREKLLSKYLVDTWNMFYGLIGLKFRQVAFELAEKLKINYNFDKANKVAGKDWLEGFLKRSPELSISNPDQVSINQTKYQSNKRVFLKQKLTNFTGIYTLSTMTTTSMQMRFWIWKRPASLVYRNRKTYWRRIERKELAP